ncbi:hypothetical protein [Adhaeribacter soli]|uniref:DUF2029 domain-containing protein n=1 Tax=Adhaeribacter soli TaxID=2607655 RepID=A0A5N1IPE8_9BACT|nr:hypothetical protein [Adhaeribacter soli]KAA9331884.1 hypothetical protein F0P94_13885 [Adhaeribacter soli]
MLVFIAPRGGFTDDINFWINWCRYAYEFGLSNIYQLENNNYNPLLHYFLAAYAFLAGNSDNISQYMPFFKAFPLFFDFVGAIAAVSFVKERSQRFALSLLLLFNAGYLYNTLIWGQVDSVFTCFVMIAVAMALRKKLVLSVIFYLLALNAKVQAIIFLPPLLLLLLPALRSDKKRLAIALLAGIAFELVFLAPFIWGGEHNDLGRIIAINFNSVDFAPVVSMSAYNFWFLTLKEDWLSAMPDNLVFWGLTYKHWGLLLFCLTSFIALLPVLLLAIRSFFTGNNFNFSEYPVILLSFGLIPILFCFFNTQMHERYWHAGLLFLAAYGFLTKEYLPYLVGSVAYLLNMEAVLRFLNFKNYKILLFKPEFVAGLFGFVIVFGFFKLYRHFNLAACLQDMKRYGNRHEEVQAGVAMAHLEKEAGVK